MDSRFSLPVLAVAIVGLVLGGRYVFYGSLTRSCAYTEQAQPVPMELVQGEIVVARDAFVAVGRDREFSCLPTLGAVDRKILGPDLVNRPTMERYYTDRGLKVEPLSRGIRFRLTGVSALTKHGLTRMDAGSGASYYLILKGADSVTYQIATASLGLSEEDLFLSLEDPAHPTPPSIARMLGPDSFEGRAQSQGSDSLAFTGRLTEQPAAP